MKTKGNSLYEVLKSASRPAGADEGAPAAPESVGSSAPEGGQPTLQERLAAYKAAKLAAAAPPAPAAELGPPRAAAATVVLEPDPTPLPPLPTVLAPAAAPLPAPTSALAEPAPAAPRGLGERVVRVTYNSILFGAMILVGLLFIAYAVGLHLGKSAALAEASPEPRRTPPAVALAEPAPIAEPPSIRKEYAIRLGEWKLVSSEERVKALAMANDPDLRKALERAGHKNFEKAFITRGKEPRMALYVDRFADINSDAAKAALTSMKTFKFAKQTPFAQAVFEELQPR